MGAFLSYSIVSGMLLLAMFAAYRLFMAEDNRHSWNRGVLLSIYALSFLSLPLIGLLRSLLPSTASAAPAVEGAIEATVEVLPLAAPAWGRALIWIFIAGMAITSLRTLMTWTRIIRVISKGERIRKKGYTLVLTGNSGMAPFSWMHYLVMSRDDHASCPDAITVHELRHITCRHWIDLLVAQAVTIINWFNPAAWLMRSQLMLVHEYQADMAVIDHRYNPKEYQLLLIRKAVGAKFPCLANSLNHSKLKKRITMMYKSKSGARTRFKALVLAPAAAVALLAASVPQVRAAISTIETSEVTGNKDNNLPANEEISAEKFKFKSINNNNGKTTVEVTGTIPGKSLTVNSAVLTNGSKVYNANGMNCRMTDGNATITVTFPFMTEFDDDTALTLEANGKKVTFLLFKNGTEPASTTKISITSGNSTGQEVRLNEPAEPNAEFYIDGKKITTADFERITPENIAEVTVDKSGAIPAVYITLKKK